MLFCIAVSVIMIIVAISDIMINVIVSSNLLLSFITYFFCLLGNPRRPPKEPEGFPNVCLLIVTCFYHNFLLFSCLCDYRPTAPYKVAEFYHFCPDLSSIFCTKDPALPYKGAFVKHFCPENCHLTHPTRSTTLHSGITKPPQGRLFPKKVSKNP